jgi:hypothetical protein
MKSKVVFSRFTLEQHKRCELNCKQPELLTPLNGNNISARLRNFSNRFHSIHVANAHSSAGLLEFFDLEVAWTIDEQVAELSTELLPSLHLNAGKTKTRHDKGC